LYFATICSANVPIVAPACPLWRAWPGKKKKAMQDAGPCKTLKSLARPDRRMIHPSAAPFAYSVVPHPISTWGAASKQGWSRIVLAKRKIAMYASGWQIDPSSRRVNR